GTFMKRRLEECYDLIENMTAHHNDWDTSTQWSESSSSITSSSDTKIAALKTKMAEINKNLMRVLQVSQQVKAVTLSCKTCGGPHSFFDCPAIVGKTQNVYVVGAYQGGTFMKIRPEECYDLIENMTAHHNDWDTSVQRRELTLRVGKEAVTFNLDQTSRYIANYDAMSVNRIDLIDVACEEYSQEVLGISDLPLHLEYAFLEGDDKLPVIIAKDLKDKEKTALIKGIILGHKISKNGIKVDKAKVDVITKLPHPTTVKDICSFLGHVSFYRRFIQDFSKIARLMTRLLEKDTPFFFSKECVEAVQTLKKKLTKAPI
nr:reverse transcriptase domain-containing protein [Tanacetum cinerariifolium]